MNVRPPTLADVAAVAALVGSYDAVHGVVEDTSTDDLRHEWRDLDLERDAWLFEHDGRLAGYACVYGRGTELLLASFGEFYRRGERRIALGVDATNPTGAVRVYERVGMHAVWRADVYEKGLA